MNHIVWFQDLAKLLTADDQKTLTSPSNASLPPSITPASLLNHVSTIRRESGTAAGTRMEVDADENFPVEKFRKRRTDANDSDAKRRKPPDGVRDRRALNRLGFHGLDSTGSV